MYRVDDALAFGCVDIGNDNDSDSDSDSSACLFSDRKSIKQILRILVCVCVCGCVSSLDIYYTYKRHNTLFLR